MIFFAGTNATPVKAIKLEIRRNESLGRKLIAIKLITNAEIAPKIQDLMFTEFCIFICEPERFLSICIPKNTGETHPSSEDAKSTYPNPIAPEVLSEQEWKCLVLMRKKSVKMDNIGSYHNVASETLGSQAVGLVRENVCPSRAQRKAKKNARL